MISTMQKADVESFDFKASLVDAIPHLRAFARSLTHNADFADDLVHDAVLRALDAAEQFTPGTNFRAWIFTILRNHFYNEVKRWRGRVVSLTDSQANLRKIDPQQEANLEFDDFQRAFWQLSPNQREVLTLVGAEGLTYDEAAQICNCCVGTVKSRVSRARYELKRLMSDDSLVLRRIELAKACKDQNRAPLRLKKIGDN